MRNPLLVKRKLILSVCLSCLAAGTLLRGQTGSYLLQSNFESPLETYNPWAGVDTANGQITFPVGSQLAVDETGGVVHSAFSAGLAVGDLNGDGLPDLVVADSRGYFWFFPNNGNTRQPRFTFGEIIPIWPGTEQVRVLAHGNAVVPRIQLIDIDGDGKLDLLVGTFEGRLYYFHNNGSTTRPSFSMPAQLSDIELKTSTTGDPWCNYLSPFFVNWFKNGPRYLILGDGTYSANSIYMLRNIGDAGKPAFGDTAKQKIIPGMGREDLTPQVVDWNGDGKPDILCGERAGYLTLFLNTSGPNDLQPTFDEGTHLRLGGRENFGPFVLPCVADLSGNKLPNLLLSSAQGTIAYAQNFGTPGKPNFASPPAPLKGTNPYPKILTARDWNLGTPYGDSYNLLVVTNDTVEPGFTLPRDHVGKNALKAYVFTPTATYFTTRYYVEPSKETDDFVTPNEHHIDYSGKITMQERKQYAVSFNVRTEGDVTDTRIKASSVEYDSDPHAGGAHVDFAIVRPFSASNSWSKVNDFLSWNTHYAKKGVSVEFGFSIRWHGEGAIYLDDITVQPQQ